MISFPDRFFQMQRESVPYRKMPALQELLTSFPPTRPVAPTTATFILCWIKNHLLARLFLLLTGNRFVRKLTTKTCWSFFLPYFFQHFRLRCPVAGQLRWRGFMSPSWSGDTADFSVNVTGQLQLNAQRQQGKVFFHPIAATGRRRMEWRFLSGKISPQFKQLWESVSLRIQVHWMDLSMAIFPFWKSLSNDAVELFRQDGTTSISFAGRRTLRSHQHFLWEQKLHGMILRLDYLAGCRWRNRLCSGSDRSRRLYEPQGYFGFICTYTSGNRQNFFFDDVSCRRIGWWYSVANCSPSHRQTSIHWSLI